MSYCWFLSCHHKRIPVAPRGKCLYREAAVGCNPYVRDQVIVFHYHLASKKKSHREAMPLAYALPPQTPDLATGAHRLAGRDTDAPPLHWSFLV